MTDAELLKAYVKEQSHDAFAVLVARHAGWVHSVARRRVRDEHLAQDVTQAVFMLLARQGRTIRRPDRLAAWLMRVTHYASNTAVRAESRRRQHERFAAMQRSEAVVTQRTVDEKSVFAALDQAVARLRAADRELVLRRFYQGRSVDSIASELGVPQDTARKRVERVLARLRSRLGKSVTAAEAGGLFASLSAVSSVNPHALGELTGNALSNSTKPSQALSICRGATQMIVRAKLRVACLALSIALIGGSAIVWGVDRAARTPGHAGAAASTPLSDRTVQGANVIVTVSLDGKKLAGYSKDTGQWSVVDGEGFSPDRLVVGADVATYSGPDVVYGFAKGTGTWAKADIPSELHNGQTPQVIVGSKVAAFSIPGAMYAFSTQTGTWDMVRLPSSTAAGISVGADYVWTETGGHYYIFGLKTAKWAAPF